MFINSEDRSSLNIDDRSRNFSPVAVPANSYCPAIMEKAFSYTFSPKLLSAELSTFEVKETRALLDDSMSNVLQLAREFLDMDVLFVGQFVSERRIFRYVDTTTRNEVIRVGDSEALENTLCKRVIDGRLAPIVHDVAAVSQQCNLPAYPFPVGSYMGVPLRLSDGELYGTLCCFTFEPRNDLGDRQLVRLKMAAKVVERLLNAAKENQS